MPYSHIINFFTKGEYPITDKVLCEFLSQRKDNDFIVTQHQTLSELMKNIRFVAPQNKVEHDADSILNALYYQYDRQNILTSKFLHYLRDIS
jgi:hypothetical protein